MRVTYTAGPDGVASGGCLRFRLPGLKLADLLGDPPVTCSDPAVSVRCSNRVARIDGKAGSEFFTINYLFVTIENAPLKPGESVSVDYGSSLLPVISAPHCAQLWAVEVATDLGGTRDAPGSGFWLVPDPPAIEFVSDRPVRLEVTIPSTTVSSEPFDAVVRARDRYNNIAAGYTGTVQLLAGLTLDAPTVLSHTFTPEDCGAHTFAAPGVEGAGINRLAVFDEGFGFLARSNPTRTWSEQPVHQLFWGDTHAHSSVSADTAASNSFIARPAGVYDYARNRSDLDFCAVTDHSEDQTPDDWAETQQAAREWNEPGRFVTFTAFEATHQPLRKDGDKNVYFLSDDQPYVNVGTTADLYRELRARGDGVMVIPHQHARTNWALHDPELERVVEIYAHWGCGLSPESNPPMIPGTRLQTEHYVTAALKRGIRVGFIASADHSGGHPGDDFWWSLSNHQGGLAAVYAEGLTRGNIWEGLWSRHCYGTTRARILIEFDIDGHGMGSEFTSRTGERRLRASVAGTAPIEQVTIVKNGHPWYCHDGKNRLDTEFTLVARVQELGGDFYYVHVIQADGEQAWSSPIWVRNPA